MDGIPSAELQRLLGIGKVTLNNLANRGVVQLKALRMAKLHHLLSLRVNPTRA